MGEKEEKKEEKKLKWFEFEQEQEIIHTLTQYIQKFHDMKEFNIVLFFIYKAACCHLNKTLLPVDVINKHLHLVSFKETKKVVDEKLCSLLVFTEICMCWTPLMPERVVVIFLSLLWAD